MMSEFQRPIETRSEADNFELLIKQEESERSIFCTLMKFL
jgi:hypothetical protein